MGEPMKRERMAFDPDEHATEMSGHTRRVAVMDGEGPVGSTSVYDDDAKSTTFSGRYALPVSVFDRPKPTDDWCSKCGEQGRIHDNGMCTRCSVVETDASVDFGWTDRCDHSAERRKPGCACDPSVVNIRHRMRWLQDQHRILPHDVLYEIRTAYENLTATQDRCNALLAERRNGPGAIRVKRLTSTAIIPKRAHDGDSGLDLHADIDAPVHIMAGTTRLIPTGISVAIPKGYEGQVRPRSGLAVKQSAAAFFGTVDSQYRGDVGVILHAHGPHSITVKPGDRIGQLCVCPIVLCDLVEVIHLDATDRGSSGFGSSGIGAKP